MTSNTTQGTSTTQASGVSYTTAATPSFSTGGPSAHGPITITTSIDKFMIFTLTGDEHAFTVPAGGLNYDILMIGGGGGARGFRGGGGAGACIVAINQTLPGGQTCSVRVGSGGRGTVWEPGGDSYIYYTSGEAGAGYKYLAKGGATNSIVWR